MLERYRCCMDKRIFLVNVFTCFILILGLNNNQSAEAADKKQMVGMRDLFISMEKSLQNGDEAAFKALWHADGYYSNPTGKSGYSGEMVFKQGSGSNGWYIKPDFKTILQDGLTNVVKSDDVVILPSHVWSFQKHKPISNIYSAVVNDGEKWLFLGLSENPKDLEEIIERFKNPWAS